MGRQGRVGAGQGRPQVRGNGRALCRPALTQYAAAGRAAAGGTGGPAAGRDAAVHVLRGPRRDRHGDAVTAVSWCCRLSERPARKGTDLPLLLRLGFTTPEVAKAFADNCRASGITWTYGRSSNDVIPRLLPQGHKVILSLPGNRGALRRAPPSGSSNTRTPGTGASTASRCCGRSARHGSRPGQGAAGEAGGMGHSRLVSTEDCAGWTGTLSSPYLIRRPFCTCGCAKEFRQYGKLPADAVLNPQASRGSTDGCGPASAVSRMRRWREAAGDPTQGRSPDRVLHLLGLSGRSALVSTTASTGSAWRVYRLRDRRV